ncbi:MAG TPA: energy-coupling factor transporter transmembrane component T [Candidatus Binatia bacterium]|nr:energy-coupling factor transporter transmembrane component T [Candidatus Binatia bacterium]
MTSSLYLDRATPLHRVHPVTKLAAAAALFAAVFSLEDPASLWPYPVLLLATAALAGALPNVWRLRALLAAIPLGALLLWTLFFAGGEAVVAVGRLRVSSAGAVFGLGMALKLFTFLLLNVVLLSTTRVEELTFAFTRLGLPYRVGFALTLAFRLVPVFVDSAGKVLQAQRLRTLGDEPRGIVARVRRTAPVIVPVFMGGLRRADRMAIALELRGFGRPGKRTGILELRVGAWDPVVLGLAFAALAAAVAVRAAGGGLVGR